MRRVYANRLARALLVLAGSALLGSCATTPRPGPTGTKGDYANAAVLSCDVKDCAARVEIDATCKSGPLKVQIWRDVPIREPVLYTDSLGEQVLAQGTTTLNIPVCAPQVRSVQALLLQIDGACAANAKDTLTAQFRCFVR